MKPALRRHARMLLAAAALLVAGGGCAALLPLQSASLAGQPHQDAREVARTVALQHCGTCHDGRLPTAKPGALAIFNLATDEFAGDMGRFQMQSFMLRLARKTSADERSAIREYLQSELARRAAGQS